MPVAELRSVSLAYGHWPLLESADLVLERGERAALIGRNGEGKSSLLKMLAGAAVADDGEVWVEPGARVVLVAQEPDFSADLTVLEAVTAQHAHRGADDEAWQVAQRIEKQMALMGLDGAARLGTLSGGMKKRVALAGALVNEPDLLLLDEPTNHLDIAGIEWLERTLLAQRGAVLVVSHDRRFLENISTRILELERGRLSSYPSRFSEYLERKAIQLNDEAVRNQKFDKLLAQEEIWIRKGVEARRTRNEGRVRRLEALRRERAARRERIGNASLAIDPGNRSGRLVADLDKVSKTFGSRAIVREFTAVIQRGDHIGLIGPNGVGKTTLIRMILGELEPDSGQIRRGTKLDVAYFDQFRAALDAEATLADVISQGSDFIEIGSSRKHIISYLEDFLFPPERARAKVKSLSGGERNRLLLARLFSRPANLLVLDEPTNDLDIETLELLESLLQEYAGTLLVVSHDRTFLNNVVTQTYAFEGNGIVREYAGGYDDWISQRGAVPESVAAGPSGGQGRSAPKPSGDRKARMSFKELRELEEVPIRIDALEREQAAITARLAGAEIYVDAPAEVKVLTERLAVIEASLQESFARWEALEAKRAAAN